MDQRSDNIRQDIEQTRASLDDKLGMLEDKAQEVATKARETFDLKHQVNERPWMALGAAVAAGYILGSMGGEEHSSPRWTGQNWSGSAINSASQGTWSTTPVSNYSHYSSSPAASYSSSPAASYSQQSSPANGPSTVDAIKDKAGDFLSQFDGEIDALKTAAVAALTNYLRSTIRELAPAVGQHLDQIRPQQSQPSYGRQASSAPNTSFSSANPTTSSADYDEIGQMNRYGAPPQPKTSGSEYFETSTTTPSEQAERSVGQTERYNL